MNLLWRKKLISSMIIRKLEKLLHDISDKNITLLLTERAKAVFPKNKSAETEQMAGFSFHDYKMLIDVSADTKHKIDEIMAMLRILKKSMRGEGLSNRSFPEKKITTLLTNYKHSLLLENSKKITFKLSNNDFKVSICPPLFNYTLDILIEAIFEHSESKDLYISFDAASRKLYLVHKGPRIPDHISKKLFRSDLKKINGKHTLDFIAAVLNEANISIDYCQIENKKAGFLIKFPLLK